MRVNVYAVDDKVVTFDGKMIVYKVDGDGELYVTVDGQISTFARGRWNYIRPVDDGPDVRGEAR